MQTLISVVRANLTHHGMKPERRPSGCRATIYGEHAQWTLSRTNWVPAVCVATFWSVSERRTGQVTLKAT